VTNNNYVATESAIEPTLTTGIVSALKKSVAGWPLIQMDANINSGSSGGPVCNEKGEVVGLTTFGSIENSGGLAAGLNFAIPVSILEEYLDSAGVTARPSETSQIFGDAVVFYDRDTEKKLRQKDEKKSSMIRTDLLVFGIFLFGAILLFRYFRKKGLKLKA